MFHYCCSTMDNSAPKLPTPLLPLLAQHRRSTIAPTLAQQRRPIRCSTPCSPTAHQHAVHYGTTRCSIGHHHRCSHSGQPRAPTTVHQHRAPTTVPQPRCSTTGTNTLSHYSPHALHTRSTPLPLCCSTLAPRLTRTPPLLHTRQHAPTKAQHVLPLRTTCSTTVPTRAPLRDNRLHSALPCCPRANHLPLLWTTTVPHRAPTRCSHYAPLLFPLFHTAPLCATPRSTTATNTLPLCAHPAAPLQLPPTRQLIGTNTAVHYAPPCSILCPTGSH
ncbi:hypothetical protein PBY51_022247 [Eleginops maclovinus]|uniref:Uncharacterized protein n=1 Tax=Eleginops maclovinus TaxID=56733 RepID=A0AAN8ALP4_ELEMC|nr:hypothetical protein PBY51_022247 [Eleginops maclovinus]